MNRMTKLNPKVEELEPRLAPVGVRLDAAGIIHVRGTSGDDVVSVRFQDDVVLVQSGKRWWQFPSEQVTAVVLLGMGGHDSLTVSADGTSLIGG